MTGLALDTIAAIATPPGESGVAVVRMSGPEAIPIASGLSPALRDLANAASHTVHYAWLRDAAGRPLDEALVTVMRAPRTFTAEDVVELGVHGGTVSARRVLRALLARGARLADRGEFTRRAFLHGRIDLAQAEAVIDLIRARTERGADSAMAGIAGGIATRTRDLEDHLLDLAARLELNLDFGEDVEAVGAAEIGEALAKGRTVLAELRARVPWGRRLREGASVVLVGRPNVGKSSLFNALLEDERAIVSPRPGTTRDYLEAWIDVAGIPVRIVDTAGQREGGEDVERAGVRRSRALEDEADLRVVVLDGSEPRQDEDRRILARTAGRPRVVVTNKSDLAQAAGHAGHQSGQAGDPAGSAESGRIETAVRSSATTADGVTELRRALERALLGDLGQEPEDAVLPNERHAEALRRTAASLDLAWRSWEEGASEELIAADVRDAAAALGEISGKAIGEEVLDRIFSGFCIGK